MDYDDIKKLNKNELLDLVKQITKYAKQRQTRTLNIIQEKYSIKPTIFREYNEKTTKFGQDRLNFEIDNKKTQSKQGRNYLLSVFFNAKNFLTSKTSTISGWEQSLKTFEETIKRKTGADFNWGEIKSDRDKIKKFYDLYNELRAKETEWKFLDSAQAFKDIAEYMTQHGELSYDILYENLKNNADKNYIKQKTEERQKHKKRDIEKTFSFDDKV